MSSPVKSNTLTFILLHLDLPLAGSETRSEHYLANGDRSLVVP